MSSTSTNQMLETDEIELIPIKTHRPRLVFLAAFAAWLGAIGQGTVLGYSSPALPNLHNDTHSPLHNITDFQSSWFNGILALGALLGGIVSGFATEKFGRKAAIILFNAPFIVGWLFISLAKNFVLFFLGRFLTGFCLGVMYIAIPVYLAEISPANLRGFLGSCFQLSVTIGVLAVYGLGVWLPWHWLAMACMAFPILSMVMMLACPETPHWLIAHKRQAEALKALHFLIGSHGNAEAECHSIEVGLLEQPSGGISSAEFILPQFWKPLVLSLCLMFFQQSNGNNNLIQNIHEIFEQTKGFLDPDLSSLLTAVIMVLATFISTLVVDRLGRKMLLIFSGFFNAISLASLGTYYYLYQKVDSSYQDSLSWLPLTSVAVFIFVFSIGYGPIAWLMMSELFPLRVRGLFSGIATAFNWTCVFIVTQEFHDTYTYLGDYGAYWLYASFSILSCLFVFFFLPETKGKKLEEIEASFQPNNRNINDSSFLPTRKPV